VRSDGMHAAGLAMDVPQGTSAKTLGGLRRGRGKYAEPATCRLAPRESFCDHRGGLRQLRVKTTRQRSRDRHDDRQTDERDVPEQLDPPAAGDRRRAMNQQRNDGE
jgi:hypothetical protein